MQELTGVALGNFYTTRLSAHPTVTVPLWLTAVANLEAWRPSVLTAVHSFQRQQDVGEQEKSSAIRRDSGKMGLKSL